ncbi:MAG: type II toxin-antitoxin system VapC family toxin [bacterium]
MSAPQNGLPCPLVVDANIVAYRLLSQDEKFSPLVAGLAQKAPEWTLPSLWQHEFANILATNVRHGRLQPGESAKIFEIAQATFGPVEQAVDLGQALALANKLGLTVYDAQYVLLAEKTGTALITEDQKLIRRLPRGRALTLEQALSALN